MARLRISIVAGARLRRVIVRIQCATTSSGNTRSLTAEGAGLIERVVRPIQNGIQALGVWQMPHAGWSGLHGPGGSKYLLLNPGGSPVAFRNR